MKKLFIYSILLASTLTFAQNKTATTEEGKKVILKSDKTWEYDTKNTTSENDCKPEDIKFISMVQEFGSGTYSLCVKGKKMKYKKVGSVFMRAEQNPLKMN